VVSVVDARRGEVFVARYRFGSADAGPADDPAAPDPDGVRAGPPELLTPEGLVNTLSALDPEPGGRVLVVGDGAVRYLDTLAGVSTVDLALAGEVSSPSPLTLGRLAARRLAAGRVAGPPIDLVPDYRREADAKINWEQRLPPTVEPTG
jgi:tRNA A37 threonylcarbamoyladenosine modification protein TsaB